MNRELLALSLSYEISRKSRDHIFRITNDLSRTFELTDNEIRQIVLFNGGKSFEGRDKLFAKADDTVRRCRIAGAEILDTSQQLFPERLRQIPGAPLVIYVKGKLPQQAYSSEKVSLAVVGTRKADDMSLSFTQAFSRKAAAWGFNVVSGLALGIDGAAHRGALEAGITTAVLGTGIDYAYPEQHLSLYNRILAQGGCIVSEYAPGETGARWHFPARNRIISALSDAVLMVQAADKSGALITVSCALEQGRDVYVFDSPALDASYSGNQRLLSDGAAPVRSFEDFLARHTQSAVIVKEQIHLSPEDEDIAQVFSKGPISAAEAALKLGRSTSDVAGEALRLLMKGLLVELPGQRYCLKS